MKLDIRVFRYLSPEDWRVLTAVELGSKNHEVVPTPLIISLSRLRGGSSAVNKSISTLAKANLIAREKNVKYDGYRLTYGGLDYLALHAHSRTGAMRSLGSQMGVGKESDIYLVTTPGDAEGGEEQQAILKLHRLGRTSFRSLRTNRAYAPASSHPNWHRLSALSAQKEFIAMRALHAAGFRVPRPIGWNRHAVVMSLVPGMPLRTVPLSAFGADKSKEDRDHRDKRVGALYADCMELILALAGAGVIHGDFNEFNILVENVELEEDEDEDNDEPQEPVQTRGAEPGRKPLIPHLIDLPQITSLSHPQAASYFDRDVSCIKSFFRKRYHFESESLGPTLDDGLAKLREAAQNGGSRLDVEVEAAGFSRKMAKELESYYYKDTSSDDGVNEQEGDLREIPSEDADQHHDEELPHKSNNVTIAHEAESAPINLQRSIFSDVQVAQESAGSKFEAVAEQLTGLSIHQTSPIRAKAKVAAGWSI